ALLFHSDSFADGLERVVGHSMTDNHRLAACFAVGILAGLSFLAFAYWLFPKKKGYHSLCEFRKANDPRWL
ncbi:MAG TPA: hypothetical protein VKA67_04215, partial [Verrucomicrobiae bacterium]|nr:hypothetical protein [Verrucomicrobiae bacterium]